jgi:hypothetical protein
MVDGTTTTATTTTKMPGLTATTNTNTTQTTACGMSGLFYEHRNCTSALMESSDDRTDCPCPDLDFHSSDCEPPHDELIIPSRESVKIRLPSGKMISRKASSPHTSKHRHRRSASPTTTTHHDSKRVHGNCAMIPDPVTVKTSTPVHKTRQPPTPPTSDSDSELEHSEHSTISSRRESTQNSLAPHVRLPTHRTTIRSSDAQMLATLPVSTQRTLLATTRKAVERAGREEQEYRRKLDGYGNLKSKERFVNDVPGGKSHKNRFMAQ